MPDARLAVTRTMDVELYTSSFCAPCAVTRSVLAEAERLVPTLSVLERNVARHPDAAEEAGIRSTPTTIVRGPDGAEVFRSEGTPTLQQVLAALVRAV